MTKRGRQIVGFGGLGLGVVSILVGSSPLFPIYLEAFVIGAGFFAAGVWVLAGPELRASVRRLLRVIRAARRVGNRPPAGPVVIDPLLPVRILRLAKKHGGILTVAEVAMELEVPLSHAEAGLGECVRAGNAVPDFDISRAHAVFRFPEFLPPDAPRLSS
jgi:hypothetical protein